MPHFEEMLYDPVLIARAFQSVRYPILPYVEYREMGNARPGYTLSEIFHIRHDSLFSHVISISHRACVLSGPPSNMTSITKSLTWADRIVEE
jgi:hypothetical protein